MKKLIAVALLACGWGAAEAKVTLPEILSDNMVLQQQTDVRLWGWAAPNGSITVKPSWSDKVYRAQADGEGRWILSVATPAADYTARSIEISDGEPVVLKNILIGEVWFCSGQSNMQMPVGKVFRRGWSAENCEEEVRNATDPQIRYAFQRLVPSQIDRLPARYSQAQGWVKCSPDVAHYFSAAAYFFGRKLRQDLKVPIGLVNASWGGTRIEPWISEEGYKQAGLDHEAGQIDRQLIAVFLLPDIGLHQILGVLAIQGAAALRDVHHAKGIVKEIIKQIFSKNAGQHKSFLHSNLLCSLRRGFLFFAPLFGTTTLYHDF